MNIKQFHEFKKTKGVCQDYAEWQVLLEFLQAYFSNRGITNPTVVELGVERNNQRHYFKKYLNADHIGIDVSDKHGKPDILGDVTDPKTLEALKIMLAGRPINLLMSEFGPPLAAIEKTMEMYGSLTEHIICLHSIETPGYDPQLYWQKIYQESDGQLKIAMFNHYPKGHPSHMVRMGKGLIVKKI